MKARKTVLAAALALAGPAQAESVVEMYGTAFPYFDSAETKNATTGAAVPPAGERPPPPPSTPFTRHNDLKRTRPPLGTANTGFPRYQGPPPRPRALWQHQSGLPLPPNHGA